MTYTNRFFALPIWCALALLPFVNSTWAQTCKLQWNTQSNCLDISSLNGDRVVLPSNVTRLSQSGLALCPLQSEQTKIPAVIFIMDQSASMDSSFEGIPAGDPQHWRGDLVRNAIQYLNEQSKGSGWFAYVEFAGDTAQDIQPPHKDCIEGVNAGAESLLSQNFLPLSDSVVQIWSTKATSPVQNRCNTGTNYFAALDKAKRYAASFDPGDVPTDLSVIFVSDGRPNRMEDETYDPLQADYVVPGKFPPVHGIFLGEEGTDTGDDLAEVANRTGGSYTLVDPNDTHAMTSVMNQIIDRISKVSLPDSVILTVNGVNYVSSRVQNALGSYDVSFPQDIPLDPGNNTIDMTILYQDTATDLTRSRVTSFTLAVEGPAVGSGIIEIDNHFAADCANGNSLKVDSYVNPSLTFGASLSQTPALSTEKTKALQLVLTAAGYSGTSTNLRIKSRRTGDVISQNLVSAQENEYTGSLPMVLSNQSPFGSVRRGDSTDKAFQVAAFDTLDFRWENPEDPRDTLVASLLLYTPPKASFLGDTLYINQIGAQVQDVAAPGARAVVEFMWFTGEFVGSTSLARIDSSRAFEGISDFQTQLLAEKSDRIIVIYKDPLFNMEYRDTAFLVFDIPEMPIAWLLDENGDGRADMLQLTYQSPRPVHQHLPNYRLRWGERNQDSVFFRVDSLNPQISTTVVQISKQGDMEQWRFPLSTPFPFGHTTGSGPLGEGSLAMKGWFNSRNVEFVIPVVDKVGPVLREMWIDGGADNVVYFTASEPLGEGASVNWINSKRGSAGETLRSTQRQDFDEKTFVFQLTLVDQEDNRIFSRDSARFLPTSKGGPRDRAGNGPAEKNPFVQVKGAMPTSNHILVAFKQSLVSDDLHISLPPSEAKESEFRVLVLDPTTGKYVMKESKESVPQRFAEAMPALGLTITLPQVTGFDQDGQPLAPESGLLFWKTTVKALAMFYDQQGQFVARRTMNVIIDDPSIISREGTVNLALVWEVDPRKGLVTSSGRSVGTGVVLAQVDIKMKSEATADMDIYNRQGQIDSKESVKTGDVIRKEKNFIARLGYIRKK